MNEASALPRQCQGHWV